MPEKPVFRQDSIAQVVVVVDGDGAFGSDVCWHGALAAARVLQGQVR